MKNALLGKMQVRKIMWKKAKVTVKGKIIKKKFRTIIDHKPQVQAAARYIPLNLPLNLPRSTDETF